MTSTTSTPPSAPAVAPEPPFAPTIVDESMRAVARAWRAQQLYLANNPTRAKALDAAKALFAPVWAETESVALTVRETHLEWFGVPILKEADRGADSLPWLLYRDGLRELTLSEGFETRDLGVLLDLLQKVRSAAPDEDDLLTLLWVADLPTVKYSYVELGAETELVTTDRSSGSARAREQTADVRQEAPELEGPPPTADTVKLEDLASTLYFLDPGEIARLRDDLVLEYATDPRRGVASALLDMLETQGDPAVRTATAAAVETLFLECLVARRYAVVAYLLREVEVVLGRLGDLAPALRSQLGDLSGQLSTTAAVEQLLAAIEEASTAPRVEDLDALFGALKPSALEAIVRWQATAATAAMRPVVERAALRLGASNSAEVVRLLGSGDVDIVRGAAQLAGTIKSAATVPALGRLLANGDATVRLAAVLGLSAIGSPGSLQALDKALDDADRAVRLAALRGIGEHRHAASAARLKALVDAKASRHADVTERVALYEALAMAARDDAVPVLDALLNARGLLGPKETPDVRAAAARGLGLVASAKGRAALEKAANDQELVVRTAVVRALRGEG
ncbi:MAG: HEAT repeat domain-containing protein, partial [Gemmatimonadaceae bacterium]|nr:HEAT repeat domain-containing protein [Gemmatimonadaceae bacterium]